MDHILCYDEDDNNDADLTEGLKRSPYSSCSGYSQNSFGHDRFVSKFLLNCDAVFGVRIKRIYILELTTQEILNMSRCFNLDITDPQMKARLKQLDPPVDV